MVKSDAQKLITHFEDSVLVGVQLVDWHVLMRLIVAVRYVVIVSSGALRLSNGQCVLIMD